MSAPAMRTGARQRPEVAVNRDEFCLAKWGKLILIVFFEFLSLTSRRGGGCADLP